MIYTSHVLVLCLALSFLFAPICTNIDTEHWENISRDSKVYAIMFNDEMIIFNDVIQLQLYDDEIMFRIFTCAQTASHNMVSRVPHSELSPSEWEQKSLDKAIG